MDKTAESSKRRKKKVKVLCTRGTVTNGDTPVGGATGGTFPIASEQSNRVEPVPWAEQLLEEPWPVLPGQPSNRRVWPIFRQSQREPD
eukprot:6319793-Amphidinium_carterae.1